MIEYEGRIAMKSNGGKKKVARERGIFRPYQAIKDGRANSRCGPLPTEWAVLDPVLSYPAYEDREQSSLNTYSTRDVNSKPTEDDWSLEPAPPSYGKTKLVEKGKFYKIGGGEEKSVIVT